MTSQVQDSLHCPAQPNQPGLSVIKSLLLSLPIFLGTTLIMVFPVLEAPPIQMAGYLLTWVFVNVIFFLMLRTGKTFKYRSIIFIIIAVTFSFSFILNLIETRGSMEISEATAISGEVPFCHIAISTILIPLVLQKTIIFPGSILGQMGVAGMLTLWIGSSLALGRGWCSWACFYGGLDEAFSRFSKRPWIKTVNSLWRYMPYAVLLFVALTSAAAYYPVYCAWLCPYKAVTEFPAVTNLESLFQFIIFASLFLGLVIVLPFLTKKRTQCGFFCPLGAIQNWTNPINIYDVRIDTEKCSQCKLCVKNCAMMALDESSLQSGKTLVNCSKCGQCVDTCSRQAIQFHIKGTKAGSHPLLARMLYLYPAFMLMSVFAASFIGDTIYRILKLITTGSLI